MNNDFCVLQSFEENLIIHYIFLNNKFTDKNIELNENTLHLINANLHFTDNKNLAFQAHSKIIDSLINYYCINKYQINYLPLNDSIEEEILHKLELNNIPNLIEELHINFLNSQFYFSMGDLFKTGKLTRTKSKHYLKEYGAVYTLKRITNEMVSKTVANTLKSTDLNDLKCLDFASGTGRFYFEAIEILRKKYSLGLKDIVCNRLYAIDVDEVALSILKCKVISLFNNIDEEILSSISRNILYRNALIPNTSLLSNSNISFDFSIDFKEVLSKGGFSAIFSNPPYYLLKVNNKKSSVS